MNETTGIDYVKIMRETYKCECTTQAGAKSMYDALMASEREVMAEFKPDNRKTTSSVEDKVQ